MDREFLIDINPDIKLPEYNLELHRLTEEPIMPLKNIMNLNYRAYYVGIDELEFDIPLYRTSNDGTKIKNEIYDLVDGEYLILLNQMKYFIIDSIKEESDDESGKVWKSIHAYSREYELSHKKLVDYKADSRVLYDDTNSTLDGLEKGVLNYIFNHVTRSWTIGYVDPDVIIKGNEGVYRALDFPNTNLLQVFQELQKTYNCIFTFNTLEQTIDIYDINKKLGQHEGLYISDYNFLKKLTKEINYDEIKTRLYVYGKDNISIQSISPTGQPYLDNFSAYKTTKHMTQGLIDALNAYEEKVNNYNPDFEPLLQQLQEANAVMEDLYNADHIDDLNQKGLIALQRKLSQIQIIIDVKTEELAIIQNTINNATGEELSDLYNDKKAIQASIDSLNAEKDNVNTLIANKQIEIDNQQNVIDDIKQQIHDLQYVLDVNNPNNFTEEQIKELDKFVRIETYNDSNYTENNITELYEEGKKLLTRISQPKIQFDTDVIDFLNVVECQHIWDKFVLGNIVTLEHSELGFNYEVRLVGYEHDIENNSLNLKFSNTNTYDDATLYLSELLEQMNTTSTAVDFNKYKWDKTDNIESQISKYVDVKLEEARQNILNAVGQRYLFDDSGLWLYKENPDGSINPEQIRAINNTIALTKNNFNTVSTAITPDGINAELVRGKLGEFAKVRANQIIVGSDGEVIPGELVDGLPYINQQVGELNDSVDNLGNTIKDAFDDGFVTSIEANSLDLARKNTIKEAEDVRSIAVSLSVSTAAITTAINNLNTEVNKYVGKSRYPIAITPTDRSNMVNKFTTLEASIVSLYKSIDEKRDNNTRSFFQVTTDAITGRVTQVETDTQDLNTRVSTAEQKITPSVITQTVESNTTTLAKKTDIPSVSGLVTKSEMTQAADSVRYEFKNIKNANGTDASIETGNIKLSKDGVKITHTGLGGQYSEMRADGFIRKWRYGEAEYLNDIWEGHFDYYGSEYSNYPTYNIEIPQRFRNRQVEGIVIPNVLNFGRALTTGRSYQMRADIVRYTDGNKGIYTNTSSPYVEVEAGIKNFYSSRVSGIEFSLIIIGY